MKKILGLDLGTNSIGWALIKHDFEKKEGEIVGLGSRIIPMSQDILGKFDSGVSISQTEARTGYRGVRRLYQRDNLRRERLHRVLNLLNFLPEHYASEIDFNQQKGQFKKGCEPKINYKRTAEGKHNFIFPNSFNEMVNEFKLNGIDQKIPYDWTIYYLRKKALTQKISKEELAWIILNFNQKRGYYQLRGDEAEETDNTKLEEFFSLKVSDVQASDDKNANGIWYNVKLENGWIYRRQSKEPLNNWIGKNKEFIVTTQLEKDGSFKTDKEGEIKRSFRAVDSEKDWIAIKSKTEKDIANSEKTVGQFIYDSLLQDPTQKIRGKLVRTIERKFYKQELKTILENQCKLHDELQSEQLYKVCIEELYPRNEAHKNNIKEKDFTYLFLEDIIFYQRPLKSKKSNIGRCTYETRTYKKLVEEKTYGQTRQVEKIVTEGIRAIPKSHPLFQEFRLWQFISNLRIIKQTLSGETDVTNLLLTDENARVRLFDFLAEKKEIEQKQLLNFFIKEENTIPKQDAENYTWNYVEDKKYPCFETRSSFIAGLKKLEDLNADEFLTSDREENLWHIIYSVKDKKEYEKALKSFALRNQIDVQTFFEAFKSFKPFDNDYAAYSLKALSKLLPVMRMGKYWKPEAIHPQTAERINKLLNGEFDTKIENRVREKAINLSSLDDYRGLPVWLACYVVYNRHSESTGNTKWETPNDINQYLAAFKQHSLRNPIVEQVVTETLRTVRDIWLYHGNGETDFFNEIHLELGREMKNPADKRKQMSNKNIENENTNQRIRELLTELLNDNNVEGDIRPYSPSHQEILKIYEEGIFQYPGADFSKVSEDDIVKIRRNNSPSNADIKRYKLWLEQGYRSPYTGEVIPLGRLFTTNYQIEHIIPQARYFDDSLSNKIICESEVNQLKGNKTAYEFIKNPPASKVTLNGGKVVTLFKIDEYEEHCNQYFKRNRAKLNKLLSEDIPEGFIERQLNDSRYISKLIKGLLSNIVIEEGEQEAVSKNLISVTGAITSKLKQDWGLNDKWNEIVAPRFMRLNEITNSTDFGYFDSSINAFRCEVPDELKRNFNKKRIDHRHHALDALVIACTNRRHIQYLNALNAENTNYALRNALLVKNKHDHFTKTMQKPWENFATDALIQLQQTIISFKQNLRVINKTNNKTWQWTEQNGVLKKQLVKQTKGDNWAIRKPMHKETVSGAVNVRIKINVSFTNGLKQWQSLVDKNLKTIIKKLISEGNEIDSVAKYFKTNPYQVNGTEVKQVEIYSYTKDATATRCELSDKFTRKQLESITDSGIRKILDNHVKNYTDEKGKEQFELAFNPDGIDELNKNIAELNGGKPHKPIKKVRIYEEGNKFSVGHNGNKNKKFVEAAKGTNLFFAVYWNEEKQKREYETVPLNVVIEHQKQVASLPAAERTPVPINNEKGRFLFTLSPNDLVYVPTEEELEHPQTVDLSRLSNDQVARIYKMVSSTGSEAHFVLNSIATLIKTYDAKSKFGELGSLNKMELDFEGNRIKEVCWKLEIDRLGNIKKVIH